MRGIVIAERLGLYFSFREGVGNPVPKDIERNMHMLSRVVITLLGH